MTRADHGTTSRYRSGCRCPDCKAANTADSARRRKLQAMGRPTTDLVDVEPVRAHVHALARRGMGYHAQARAAGVAWQTFARITHGDVRRIRATTARRIYALRPELAPLARVDGTGTRRRLCALVADGWPIVQLADRLDMCPTHLQRWLHTDAQTSARTAARAAAMFEDMSGTDDPSPIALRTAQANGWPPSAAWVERDMDDPRTRPDWRAAQRATYPRKAAA